MTNEIRTYGNAYTSDPDYNNFFGKQYTRTIYDWSRRCWVECVMQAPKTPQDRLPRVDPNALITDDGTDLDGNVRYAMGMHSKTAIVLEVVHNALEDRPLSTRMIAEMVGLTVNRIKHLLLNHPQGLTILGRTREGHVYGLTGRVYDTVLYFQGMEKIVNYIKTHGPSPISVLCRELKMVEQNFHKALASNPGVLHVVGIASNPGKKPMRLWGLVGIHDREAT